MDFNLDEARAIIEAAKKRGAIRGPGCEAFSDAEPRPAAEPKNLVVLPEWLQNGINGPTSEDRPASPAWRSE